METPRRPISPHLQIYNIFSAQLTSGPSFLNRATGMGLAVGLIYLCAWLFMLSLGEIYYNYFLKFITSWFGYLSLLGISLCFFYHLINGIRFLIFDLGYMITKRAVFISGIYMLILTVLCFTLMWAYIVCRNI